MELAYRKTGEGKPLVILHGLFGQSDNWNSLAKRFAAGGYAVYTVDLRNHGLSPHSDEWSYEIMAMDVLDFFQQHKMNQPILIGHSMGGKVAMFVALQQKNSLSKLVVVDIAPRAYEAHHQEVFAALQAVDFTSIKTRKEAENIMARHLQDAGTRQFLLKNIYWKDTAQNQMDWRFNLKVIQEKYESIGVEAPADTNFIPVLFMSGEKSSYIRLGDLIDIERRFPNYHLVTIPGAGHWIHAEQPDLFYEEVMKFIGETFR